MLATTWSKPIATNAVITGKKTARILLETEVAADVHTADKTSQLQPTPRRKVSHALVDLALGDRRQPLVGEQRAALGRVADDVGLDGEEEGDEQRSEQVAQQHQGEVLGDVGDLDLAAHGAERDQHHVAGREVRAGDEHQDEPEGERRPPSAASAWFPRWRGPAPRTR